LHQLVAVLTWSATAQPGVAERSAQLPHHLPQRQLLAEERHLFIRDTGASDQVNARVGPHVLTHIRECRPLEGQGHPLDQAGIDDFLFRL
jgi:hypothetical protein